MSPKPAASASRRIAPPSVRARTRRAVLFLFAAFALRGIFLNLALPYGDPLDEIFHFGYAVFLEATGHPPAASEVSMPDQLLRPLRFLPRSTSFPGPKVSWSEASRWTPGERERIWREAFPPRSGEPPVFVTTNYESQQPPLFYLGAAILLRALKEIPLETQLLILRLAATLVAALSVPLAHAFFRRLLSRRGALAATAAFVAFPGIGIFTGRFTNDALAMPIVTALLVVFADTGRGRLSILGTAALAVLLAAGCWTKLYVLLLLPAAPLIALRTPRGRRSVLTLRASVASAVSFLAVLPWLARQHADTGDWFGMLASRQAERLKLGLGERLHALPDLLHIRFGIVFGRTFLWPGTWSAMGAQRFVAVVLFLALSLLALLPLFLRGGSSLRRRVWWGTAVVLPLFLLGYAAYASTFAAVARRGGYPPSAGPDGWYLLILFPVLLAAGCARGHRVPSEILLIALGVFIVAEGLLTLGVLPAVYSGWTTPNGSNAPLRAWLPMATSPFFALATYASVGLARTSVPALGLVLATELLALLAAIFPLVRRARPPGQ